MKNNLNFCLDCAEDGKQCQLAYDHKFLGEVCPRCERVTSPAEPAGNKRYTTKVAATAAIARDARLERHRRTSTRGMVERIMADRSI